MQDSYIQQRIELCVHLLSELKTIYSSLKLYTEEIENNSGSFYEKLFQDSRNEIDSQLVKYRENFEKIKQLNLGITCKINDWYKFIKKTEEVKRPLFPIRFYFGKRKLLKDINKINDSISQTSIENRFIKESVTNWEHELEQNAIRQIKLGESYTKYINLIKQKDFLVSELKYLLTTLPALPSIKLDLDNIDQLIDLIKDSSAA